MTEIKNVGRMEQLLLSGIASIVATYLVGDALFDLALPTTIGWVLVVFVIGYFLNRVWLQIERYIENVMLIMRMRAEQDKQRLDFEIAKAESLKRSLPVVDVPKPTPPIADEPEVV